MKDKTMQAAVIFAGIAAICGLSLARAQSATPGTQADPGTPTVSTSTLPGAPTMPGAPTPSTPTAPGTPRY